MIENIFKSAVIHQNNKNFSKAREIYEELLKTNPENIVITLYGNGVSPANKTTQNPHLLCIVVKAENFSL